MHVDPARSRAVVRAAQVASSLERTVGLAADEVDRRLRSCRASACGPARRCGSGRTATPTRSVRRLPRRQEHRVGADRPEVDDDGLAELLEPYRPHRYRVQRLVERPACAAAARSADGAAAPPAGLDGRPLSPLPGQDASGHRPADHLGRQLHVVSPLPAQLVATGGEVCERPATAPPRPASGGGPPRRGAGGPAGARWARPRRTPAGIRSRRPPSSRHPDDERADVAADVKQDGTLTGVRVLHGGSRCRRLPDGLIPAGRGPRVGELCGDGSVRCCCVPSVTRFAAASGV